MAMAPMDVSGRFDSILPQKAEAGVVKKATAGTAKSEASRPNQFAEMLEPGSDRPQGASRADNRRLNDEPIPSVATTPAASVSTPTPAASNPTTSVSTSGAAVTAPAQAPGASEKQRALQEFMQEMQEKFGVTPEQILAAFASLSETALMGPPEGAAKEFLAQLNLPPAKMGEALGLYQKLVRQTGAAMDVQVFSPKEMRSLQTQSTIDRLSSQFFVQPQTQAQTQSQAQPLNQTDGNPAVLATPLPASGSTSATTSDSDQAGLLNQSLIGLGALGASASVQATAQGAALTSESAAAVAATATPAPAANQVIENSLISTDNSQALIEGMDTVEMLPEQVEMKNGGSGTALAMGGATIAGLAAALSQQFASGDQSKRDSSTPDQGQDSSELAVHQTKNIETDPSVQFQVQSSGSDQRLQAQLGAAGVMFDSNLQATPDEMQKNITELIQQAQVMMKKGGGEMKLQMTPEGLGQVHLRVSVQDGQVQVQMLTESDAAKKLLENGLNDLKSNLTAQKLHVESLKVDAAADSAFKKFEQGFQDSQREQARQFASDFLGQFRDDRQGFYQGFMERPNLKGYGRNQNRAQVEPAPVDAAQSAASQRSRDGQSSRRLDLVA